MEKLKQTNECTLDSVVLCNHLHASCLRFAYTYVLHFMFTVHSMSSENQMCIIKQNIQILNICCITKCTTSSINY